MSRRLKIILIVIVVILITGFLLYKWREKIVGQFVPEVTRVYYANLIWEKDSLIGDAALEIRNKSGTQITIDSLELQFSLGGVRFVNLKQEVNIDLEPQEYDSLKINIDIPIKQYFSFLDSVKNIDSTLMAFSLNIYYNTKGGDLKLPIKKEIMIASPKKILVNIEKVEIIEYNDKKLNANVHLFVLNAGKLEFKIEDIKYSFLTSGDISTEGTYEKEVILKPGDETVIILPVQLSIDKPLQTITDVISDNDSYFYEMDITGIIKANSEVVNNMVVKLEKSGVFEVKKASFKDNDYKQDKKQNKEKRKDKKKENKN